MVIAEFVDKIKQELTVACAIPITIHQKEIERLIALAAKWFYQNYEFSTEERYYIIPVPAFSVAEFKATRQIRLPTCVQSVFAVKELHEGTFLSMRFDGTADMDVGRIMMKDLYAGSNMSDGLMYYVINSFLFDLASHILNHTVSFNYNYNTKKLFLPGETPDKDVIVSCYVEIPLENLLDDQLFYRYVSARAKMQLSRMLGTFQFNLPGGIPINFEMIRDEGKDELKEVQDEIKDQNANDFFFTTGGT